MLRLTSRASELFLQQPAVEQRRLLQMVVQKAAWKDGTLQTALFEPFEILRHSNQETYRKERRKRGLHENWESGSPRTRFCNFSLKIPSYCRSPPGLAEVIRTHQQDLLARWNPVLCWTMDNVEAVPEPSTLLLTCRASVVYYMTATARKDQLLGV